VPKGKGLTKICRFSQEKLKLVPKKKRFNQIEQIKVMPKGKGLTKNN
jgi:hypothetical protein